jgi:hypothetical protein
VLDLIVMDDANPRALHLLADGVLDFLRVAGALHPARVAMRWCALGSRARRDLHPDSARLASALAQLRQAT